MQREIKLVSVIVPIYNMQAFLAETIESVLASSYQNFEVILMDDGSTDNSSKIAIEYAEKDTRLKFFVQENGGASKARNHAIEKASGTYILPVDADNLISKDYIEEAVKILEKKSNVKIVTCNSVYFGDKQGPVNLPPFSLKLLARKNLMDNCAMYRKSDWEIAGGYCSEIMGREDWDFWISMLKTGGDVYKLPLVGLHYRVTPNSKRKRTRHLKAIIIGQMNMRHKAFFYKMLGGKLRKSRTWSKVINFLLHIIQPETIVCNPAFNEFEEFVYSSPETLKENPNQKRFVVNKREVEITYIKPRNIISQIIKGDIFKSKVQNLYENSDWNQVIGYYEIRTLFLFKKESYFIHFTKAKTDLTKSLKPKASLIISVYKNVEFLKAVLDSLRNQSETNFEIIIAEDGESDEVKNFIANYDFINSWQHLTQKDLGWRKNQAMNQAIRSANADWLIFVDGDCVLHRNFIEMHLRYANENLILAGKRVKLDKNLSQKLLDNSSFLGDIQKTLLCKLILKKGQIKFLEEGLFISPDGFFGFIPKNRKLNRLKGCNMSFSKTAITAINGFDEDYILPAIGEDIDLSWRFKAAGYTHKSVRNLAVQYHLFHKENWVSQTENIKIMKNKIKLNEFVCKNGLIKKDY